MKLSKRGIYWLLGLVSFAILLIVQSAAKCPGRDQLSCEGLHNQRVGHQWP